MKYANMQNSLFKLKKKKEEEENINIEFKLLIINKLPSSLLLCKNYRI